MTDPSPGRTEKNPTTHLSVHPETSPDVPVGALKGQLPAPLPHEEPIAEDLLRPPPIEPDNERTTDLKRHKFGLQIESIAYSFQGAKSVQCIIVLSAKFRIREDVAKLQSSLVSLQARIEGDSVKLINIYPFPSGDEFVEHDKVANRIVKSGIPDMSFNSPFGGAAVRNIGKSTTTAEQVRRGILLGGSREDFTDHISLPPASWHFLNEHELYYPKDVKFLVVVDGKPTQGRNWFEFQLHLLPDLCVDVHSVWMNRYQRLKGVFNSKGWHFKIRGNFQADLARDAYAGYKRDRFSGGFSVGVGLKAAADGYHRDDKGPINPELPRMLAGPLQGPEPGPAEAEGKPDPDPLEYLTVASSS